MSRQLIRQPVRHRAPFDPRQPLRHVVQLKLVCVPNGWGTGYTLIYVPVTVYYEDQQQIRPSTPDTIIQTPLNSISISQSLSTLNPLYGPKGALMPVIDQRCDFPAFNDSPFPEQEDWINSVHIGTSGTPYPFDAHFLATHRNVYAPYKSEPGLHWSTVVGFMEQHNDPERRLTESERAALHRLQELGSLDKWSPDVIMKAFRDCDVLFFGGRLSHNVYLKWIVDPYLNAGGVTYPHGYHSVRVCIGFPIGPTIEKTHTVHDFFATLLHEMCHAILAVYCGWETSDTTIDRYRHAIQPQFDAAHAEAFTRCLSSVQWRLGQTRYLKVGHTMYEPGGTIDVYSLLGRQWMREGGFRTRG